MTRLSGPTIRALVTAASLVFLLARLATFGLPGATAAGTPVQIATQFVASVVSGDYAGAEADLSPALQAAVPEDKLRQTWQAVIAQLGPFH